VHIPGDVIWIAHVEPSPATRTLHVMTRGRDPRFGPFQPIISANAFVEIDHLAPIIPTVDVTNRSVRAAGR
jgi:hypothetical protein